MSEHVPSAEWREEVLALWRKYDGWFRFDEPPTISARDFWSFIAALDAKSAERTRAEVERVDWRRQVKGATEFSRACRELSSETLVRQKHEIRELQGQLALARAEVEKMREDIEAWNKLVHDFVGHAVNSWQYMKNANVGMRVDAQAVVTVHDDLEGLTNRWIAMRGGPVRSTRRALPIEGTSR